jgi:glycosyltransferase involved in cell wall biosynthesis
VYESLRAQTLKDFEWLVIDNESTDGTEALVARWIDEADFPIRYIRQVNKGLTVSWNRAVAEARGVMLATLASDDSCYPNALERLWEIWSSIPLERRDEFASIATLCVDERGELHGDRFPTSPLDVSALEMRYRYGVRGEKWGCQRVDVMRRFPFPVVDGYLGYMPESIVWDAIARSYKERCVNEELRVYWSVDEESLSRPKFVGDGAMGGMIQTREQLSNDLRYLRHAPKEFLLAAIRYSRFSFHVGRSIRAQLADLRGLPAKALVLTTLPIGLARYLWDVRGRRPRRPNLGVFA